MQTANSETRGIGYGR